MSKFRLEELLLNNKEVWVQLQNKEQYLVLREALEKVGYTTNYASEGECEAIDNGINVLKCCRNNFWIGTGTVTREVFHVVFEDVVFEEDTQEQLELTQLTQQALTIHKLQEENKQLKTQLEGARKGMAKLKINIQDNKGEEDFIKAMKRQFPEATKEIIELIGYEYDLRFLNELDEGQIKELLEEKQNQKTYYKFEEPYYALIYARDSEEAGGLYEEFICDIEDREQVVYKPITLAQAKSEVAKCNEKWYEVFGNPIMLVDGALQ